MAGATAVAVLAGLGACGGGGSSASPAGAGAPAAGGGAPDAVTVYSSLTLRGAAGKQGRAIVRGIELALAQADGRAGSVEVAYVSLDDATARSDGWNPNQASSNARQAARDPATVAFIGNYDSGASKLSIPILNQLGVAQVSPANTDVGLTTDGPGSAEGEPAKYQPTGEKSYARIVPRDTFQGRALVQQMKSDGCTNLALAADRATPGVGLASVVQAEATERGLTVGAQEAVPEDAADLRSLAARFASVEPDCFLFTGTAEGSAAQLYGEVAAALPEARLYGADGVCTPAVTDAERGGIPRKAATRFSCTRVARQLSSYPGGREFSAAFAARFPAGEREPDPYAIYGYEAMKLVLDAITRAGDRGTERAGVVDALFATEDRDSVLGTYSIDENGDTTLTAYGLYNVDEKGNPDYVSTITPTP